MATALTGVHASQPALATRPASLASVVWPAARLSATALASVPPNHAAKPTSCNSLEGKFSTIRPPCEIGVVPDLRRFPRYPMQFAANSQVLLPQRGGDLAITAALCVFQGCNSAAVRQHRIGARVQQGCDDLDVWSGTVAQDHSLE